MGKTARRRKLGEDEELARGGGRWSLPAMRPEGTGELALPLVGGLGRAYDFPLSRDEKVGRLLALFQQEVDEDLVEEREFREEMRRGIKKLKSEFRGIRKIARAAAEKEPASPRASSRCGSPPKTPPTPPPQPRQPRQSAPPAPLGLGRRRSSIVVVPLFPKGFDPSVDQCPGASSGTPIPERMRSGIAPETLLPSPPPRSRRRSSVGAPMLLQTPTRSVLEATPEERELWAPQDLPAPLEEATSRGTIAAIQWGGRDVVDWLRFLPVGQDSTLNKIDNEGFEQLLDYPGEYIKAIYGRAEITDGRSADWVVIETSKQRLQIGCQNVYNPTFEFFSAPGHELVGVEAGPCGRIRGARQQPFMP